MFNNPDLHFPKTFRKTDGGSCIISIKISPSPMLPLGYPNGGSYCRLIKFSAFCPINFALLFWTAMRLSEYNFNPSLISIAHQLTADASAEVARGVVVFILGIAAHFKGDVLKFPYTSFYQGSHYGVA